MLLLNFNLLSIRARHLVPEREAAVDAFNDAKNPVQVLVMSERVLAISLNLEKDYADVVFVERRMKLPRPRPSVSPGSVSFSTSGLMPSAIDRSD